MDHPNKCIKCGEFHQDPNAGRWTECRECEARSPRVITPSYFHFVTGMTDEQLEATYEAQRQLVLNHKRNKVRM